MIFSSVIYQNHKFFNHFSRVSGEYSSPTSLSHLQVFSLRIEVEWTCLRGCLETMVTGKIKRLLYKAQVFICMHAPRLQASGACKLNHPCVVTSVCVSYDRIVSTRDTIPDSGYDIRGHGQRKSELKLRLDSLHLTHRCTIEP